MPGYARKEIVREGEVGVYHCVARCVRRAFLCGHDPVSGNDYEHRKKWLQGRLEQLAGIFGVEVAGYAILSNHLHAILRTRPDVVEQWPDKEIVLRMWRLFPKRRDEQGQPADPTEYELNMLAACPEVVGEHRKRLASISWFMRCLCEPIARRANCEDNCSGRFWEGRFRSQIILDESALLACSLYVDLNPIRAAICDRPEEAEFTSAHDRIHSCQARQVESSCENILLSGKASPSASRRSRRNSQSKTNAARDGWLCPIRPEEPASCAASAIENVSSPSRRASDQSCLAMSLDDYLQILDWAGRQIRANKRGSIPQNLLPILERLAVVPERWIESVCEFGRRFHRAVGHPERVLAEAARCGKQWFGGISMCRQAFT